jgi:hypothetical protein
MHRPVLPLAFGCEREAGFRIGEHAFDQFRRIGADGGTVLEAVARAGADQIDVGPARMDVDQEVAIGAVLILADPCFVERRAL